ncbi:MAG: cytochrome c [Comamonadaceae bacterium]|nr:cytochrome c [Comamonadaceae bacterium]
MSAVAAGADAERAKQIVAGKCFMCHGMDGESASRSYPRLAGQHSEYVAKQLADFKSGRRKGDTMNDMVTDLTPEDMKALAAYFEAKKSRTAQDRRSGSGSGRALHLPQGQPVLADSRLRLVPRREGSGHAATAAPGRPAGELHRQSAQAVQQSRAQQRQRGDALDRVETDRARNEGGGGIHLRAGLRPGGHGPPYRISSSS